MKTAKNETAKSKGNAEKRARLKPTTRAMLHSANLMRALYPHGRAFHARQYRERRRLGWANVDVLDIDNPAARERKKKLEAEYEAELAAAAAAERTTTDEPSADSAPCEDSSSLHSQDSSVDKDASVSTPQPTPRRRRPRAVPQKRQAEFSFGSD
jgi:hypothetical protein